MSRTPLPSGRKFGGLRSAFQANERTLRLLNENVNRYLQRALCSVAMSHVPSLSNRGTQHCDTSL